MRLEFSCLGTWLSTVADLVGAKRGHFFGEKEKKIPLFPRELQTTMRQVNKVQDNKQWPAKKIKILKKEKHPYEFKG